MKIISINDIFFKKHFSFFSLLDNVNQNEIVINARENKQIIKEENKEESKVEEVVEEVADDVLEGEVEEIVEGEVEEIVEEDVEEEGEENQSLDEERAEKPKLIAIRNSLLNIRECEKQNHKTPTIEDKNIEIFNEFFCNMDENIKELNTAFINKVRRFF